MPVRNLAVRSARQYILPQKGEALFQVFTDGAVAMLERVLKWDGKSWEG